jgi:hypothetical protein
MKVLTSPFLFLGTSLPPVSQVSRKCVSLWAYGPPGPVAGIALPYFTEIR